MSVWPISTLTDSNASKGAYLFAALVAAIVPAQIIGIVLSQVLDPAQLEAVNEAVLTDEVPFPVLAFLLVVFAPVVETFFMVIIFWVTRLLRCPPWLQVAIQVVIWAIAHGSQAFAWAFAPAWLFFIFSIVYLTRRKNSFGEAFALTTLVHAGNNAIPTALLALQVYGVLPEAAL